MPHLLLPTSIPLAINVIFD
uniref:Uncharacterized protein n=1 Tax=Rhizophora mucronata TaxID=61149 RepID=A0A2P2QXG6_RHIMU